jgi:aryl-alcohol dehydrogenase-like predicted oxidoreductase
MEKIIINNLKISKLCLGSHQFFDPKKNMTKEEIKKILFYAIDKGINFIDTADEYGSGECEKFLGKFIKQNNLKIIIATKVGQLSNFDTSKLQSEIDNSIKRLSSEALDICYFHSGTNKNFFNDKFWEIIQKNIKCGKIKNAGLSFKSSYVNTNDFSQIKNMSKFKIQILNIIYNPLLDKAKKIFSYCSQKNIKIISRVPFDKGSVFEDKNKIYIEKKLKDKNINAKKIINWIKSNKNIESIVFGVTKIKQIKELI